MSWEATLRRIEAERKRAERAALTRQRLLEKKLKELEKLSALEQAQLEVEAYENTLDVLLSVHKEASPNFDWFEPLSVLPPFTLSTSNSSEIDAERVQGERMRKLARRVLAGNAAAYGEALQELSPFSEIATLGSFIEFSVAGPKVLECELYVTGRGSIPTEVKSLTASGKLSKKAMPKARMHELYQDYVCGCVLRVAREVLALLPIETAIVTANVSVVSSKTGIEHTIPVLSVIMPREVVEDLNFAILDPSDSMENFQHRGNVMASRKSGEFTAISPFMAEDILPNQRAKPALNQIIEEARALRRELAANLNASKVELADLVTTISE